MQSALMTVIKFGWIQFICIYFLLWWASEHFLRCVTLMPLHYAVTLMLLHSCRYTHAVALMPSRRFAQPRPQVFVRSQGSASASRGTRQAAQPVTTALQRCPHVEIKFIAVGDVQCTVFSCKELSSPAGGGGLDGHCGGTEFEHFTYEDERNITSGWEYSGM